METKHTEIKIIPLTEIKIGNFQVWSKMTEERFANFVEDIKHDGVRDLVHVDESMTVLDGHHRYEACKILGISKVVVKVYHGLGADEKLAIAYKNNTLTRELSREEKIAKAIELRKGGRSFVQIGEWLGVGKSTVDRWVKEFSSFPNGNVEKIEGRDGKQRPSEQPTADEKRQRRERVKELREQGGKIADIANEVGVAVGTVYNDIKAIEEEEKRAEKEREGHKRKQRLELLELEAKLTEETAPSIREDESLASPNNMVIYARQKAQAASIAITGSFEKVSEADTIVRATYLQQIKSLVESGLITLGQYATEEGNQEVVLLCLELLKKYE